MRKITTDHKWKPFSYRYEVPDAVLADQFDHLDEDDAQDGFFKYHGHWYHLSDFLRVELRPRPELQWDGYVGDSMYSGVLIRVADDGESYQVATWDAGFLDAMEAEDGEEPDAAAAGFGGEEP